MTQDEIIRSPLGRDQIIDLALEAGFDVDEGLFPFEAAEDKYIGTERTIERFAALVAAYEREACAKVCERLISGDGICADDGVWIHDCAAAIRARDEK